MQAKLEKLCTTQRPQSEFESMGLKVNYCLLLSSFLCIQIPKGVGVVNTPPPSSASLTNAASAAYYVFVAKHNGKEEIF